MKATLYVAPGSHPSMAGRLMLEHKGIAYRRVDLIAALHKPAHHSTDKSGAPLG